MFTPALRQPTQVVVTRAPEQSVALCQRLSESGWQPVNYPVISVSPPADGGAALAEALEQRWDWLVLTSGNALRALTARVSRPPAAQIAVIGPATADLLRAAGWPVSLLASKGDARSLLADLTQRLPAGSTVLLPQAANARPLLRDGLVAAGLTVGAPESYATHPHQPSQGFTPSAVAAVTLASSATVDRFLKALTPGTLQALLSAGVAWVAIGRETAKRCRQRGIGPLVIAAEPTVAGMVNALGQAPGVRTPVISSRQPRS